MQHILVYGDSLSWGIVPTTRQRLAFDQRWPGVMENRLLAQGERVRVSEDCLNGRRTVWEDSFRPGRNGHTGLAQRMEIHSPLALVVLMLGTNDFQSLGGAVDTWHSSQGILTLVNTIRSAAIEPGMPVPRVLVVAPPEIGVPQGTIAPKFAGGAEKSRCVAQAYRAVCDQLQCDFFDAGSVVKVSPRDGIHLDAPEHRVLGERLAEVVSPLLAVAR
jgi:lysophospholipase L1-like esterase